MSDTMIAENVTVETVTDDTKPVPAENILTEQQEQVLQTVEPVAESEIASYSDEEFAQLKAQSEDDENLDPEEFTTARMQDYRNGRLTSEQFEELMGMSYEDCLAELGEQQEEPGIGHNQPPANINPTALEVAEELRAFKPTVENAAEAEREVKEALFATVEHISSGETSLASKGAIAIANWVAFNAGLRNDGNKLIAVNIGMYDKILASISGMVDSEDAKDPTFKTTVGQMIKRAILIMDGKLRIGFFVLPGDRKRVRSSDNASLEYPNDVPEGAKVVRSTVIADAVLRPFIPHIDQTTKKKIGEVDNTKSDRLVLVTNDTVDVLWRSLWDRDGEIQYSPITGAILAFKTGQMLRDEETKAKAQLERDKKTAEATKRQTRGTQAEDNNGATIEQLKEQLAEAKNDASAAVEANRGDIISGLNSLGALIRDSNTQIPEQARIVFWKDANAMFARRLLGPNVKPSRDELRELVKLAMNLDNHLKWNDKDGVWQYLNVDGNIVTTFSADSEDKAA